MAHHFKYHSKGSEAPLLLIVPVRFMNYRGNNATYQLIKPLLSIHMMFNLFFFKWLIGNEREKSQNGHIYADLGPLKKCLGFLCSYIKVLQHLIQWHGWSFILVLFLRSDDMMSPGSYMPLWKHNVLHSIAIIVTRRTNSQRRYAGLFVLKRYVTSSLVQPSVTDPANNK